MSDLIMSRSLLPRSSVDRTMPEHGINALRKALRAYLTRRALPNLSARELDDIGVTQIQALDEAARLPWDFNPDRRGPGSGTFDHLRRALERFRTRRLLARLPSHDLSDLMLSPTDAEIEASKPFWR